MSPTKAGVFFIHIMKTGGTSVSHALSLATTDFYPPRGAGTAMAKRFPVGLDPDHPEQWATQAVYSVHMPVSMAEHVAPGYFTAAVVRDPVARTVSHLRHLAAMDTLPDELDAIYAKPEIRTRLANYQTRAFSIGASDYLRELNPEPASQAIDQ